MAHSLRRSRSAAAPSGAARLSLEADGLRWLIGVPTGVLGAMMLAIPGGFAASSFSLAFPELHLWGIA